jgi:ABC-2 type transport system permease protein
MKDTLWLVRKTMRTTFKQWKNWILFLVVPVIGITVAFLTHGGSEDAGLRIGLVNLDAGQRLTDDVIGLLAAAEGLQLRDMAESESNERLISGEVDAVVKFPAGFARGLNDGLPLPVDIVSIKGAPVTGYLKAMLSPAIANLAAIGSAAQGDEAVFEELYAAYRGGEFRLTTVQTEDRSADNRMSAQSIGYLAMLMLFAAVNLSSIMIKEKENRTYHRQLCAPISARTYVASNVFVNLFVMLLQIAFALVVMTVFFRIDPGMPIGLLFAVLAGFAPVAVGLSLMIVTLADSSMKANALQTAIIIPTSLLAGCMFPIDAMPAQMRAIGEFFPQHWLLDAVERLQQGVSPAGIALNLAILLAFAVTFSLAAAYRIGRNTEMRSYY